MTGPDASFPVFARRAAFHLHADGRTLACAMSLVAAPLEDLEAAAPEWLAPEEAALLTGRLAPARRQSLLAGRWAAKNALGLLDPGTAARDIRILPGLFGQPVATLPGRANLQVTLAHAGTAALAVAHPESCPMGVDLERATPEPLRALREQTTPAERERARAALPLDEAQRLLLLWCLKEALSKALRCGLTVPFHLLEVASLAPLPGGLRARFAHFAPYEGTACAAGPFALAMVRPHMTHWEDGSGPAPPLLLHDWLVALSQGPSPAPGH